MPHGSQVDEDVGRGVLIGNSLPVAQLGAFDAQSDGLAENSFDGRISMAEDRTQSAQRRHRGRREKLCDLCVFFCSRPWLGGNF